MVRKIDVIRKHILPGLREDDGFDQPPYYQFQDPNYAPPQYPIAQRPQYPVAQQQYVGDSAWTRRLKTALKVGAVGALGLASLGAANRVLGRYQHKVRLAKDLVDLKDSLYRGVKLGGDEAFRKAKEISEQIPKLRTYERSIFQGAGEGLTSPKKTLGKLWGKLAVWNKWW